MDDPKDRSSSFKNQGKDTAVSVSTFSFTSYTIVSNNIHLSDEYWTEDTMNWSRAIILCMSNIKTD